MFPGCGSRLEDVLMPSKEEHKNDDCSSDSMWGLPEISDEDPMHPPLLSFYMSDDDCMPVESPDEDSISRGGEAKRMKLESDPLGFSHPSFTSNSGGERVKSNRQEKMDEVQTKLFDFSLMLSECTLIKHDSSLDDLLGKIESNGLCADLAKYMIHRKIHFKQCILDNHALYDTAKQLYDHVPCITFDTTLEEAKAMANWSSSPFVKLDDVDLYRVFKIYKDLLSRTEGLSHPLIRKSYRDELFPFLTNQAKLEAREFIMVTIWRSRFFLGEKRKMLQLAVDRGYRDKKYQDYCRHIQLHEAFDLYVCVCENVKHDSNIEDLIHDETVFPEKFKGLDPELKRLSLEAWIKYLNLHEDCKWCSTQLQLLEAAHWKNETADIDKLLIDLHSEFPGIFSLPMDSLDDNALEERIKDATDKMKEMWFPRLSYHRVLEITLLYMEHLVSESKTEGQSWSTQIFKKIKFFGIKPWEICHEHHMYQYVMDREYTLA